MRPAAQRPHVMRRKVFNFAAALSLVLCVATATLWVVSYASEEHFGWTTPTGTTELHSSLGKFALYVESVVTPPYAPLSRPRGFTYDSFVPSDKEYVGFESVLRLAGFALVRHNAGAIKWWVLVAPAWAITGSLAVLPIVWVLRFRAGRGRRDPRVCGRCRYDLRATPNRCPECGAPQPSSKSTLGNGHTEKVAAHSEASRFVGQSC